MRVVTKPWGKEYWLELNEYYCFKKIHFNAGFQCSLQYHEKKIETIYFHEGAAVLWIDTTNLPELKDYKTEAYIFNEETYRIAKINMQPGDTITIPPFTAHRISAITDVITFETSTPEVDDCIRLHDDTGRPSGVIETESQINE